MPTQVRTFLSAVLGVAFFVLQAEAADESANYVVRRWQTEDGLPQNAVTSVAQTRDGYIWVGTYSGLARFDGEHFKIFNAANTKDTLVQALCQLIRTGPGISSIRVTDSSANGVYIDDALIYRTT